MFGICLGAPDTYNGVLVLAAFVGVGIGGNVPIDTTICLELLPRNKRWLLPTLSVFQPLGVIVCSAIAYAFIPFNSCDQSYRSCNIAAPGEACCSKADNWGWRYTMFTLGGITISAFIGRFFLFRFKESPKFLLFRGQDAKAVEVLEYIAQYNKVPCNISIESFNRLTEDDSSLSGAESDGRIVLGSGEKQKNLSWMEKVKFELVRLRVLFSSPIMSWLTICVFIIYMFDYVRANPVPATHWNFYANNTCHSLRSPSPVLSCRPFSTTKVRSWVSACSGHTSRTSISSCLASRVFSQAQPSTSGAACP